MLELTRHMLATRHVWEIPAMNRVLVEEATHPDRVRSAIDEKGDDWERYDRMIGGARAADGQIARMNALDRTIPFDEDLRFPASDQRIMTRLGEEGAVLELEGAPIGPFGRRVTRIALPPHWSYGVSDDQQIRVEPADAGFALLIGDKAFRYARTGLFKAT